MAHRYNCANDRRGQPLRSRRPQAGKWRTGEGRSLSREGETRCFKARKNFCVSSCGKVVAVYGWFSTVLHALFVERNDFFARLNTTFLTTLILAALRLMEARASVFSQQAGPLSCQAKQPQWPTCKQRHRHKFKFQSPPAPRLIYSGF